jgi:hypothetical protein
VSNFIIAVSKFPDATQVNLSEDGCVSEGVGTSAHFAEMPYTVDNDPALQAAIELSLRSNVAPLDHTPKATEIATLDTDHNNSKNNNSKNNNNNNKNNNNNNNNNNSNSNNNNIPRWGGEWDPIKIDDDDDDDEMEQAIMLSRQEMLQTRNAEDMAHRGENGGHGGQSRANGGQSRENGGQWGQRGGHSGKIGGHGGQHGGQSGSNGGQSGSNGENGAAGVCTVEEGCSVDAFQFGQWEASDRLGR